LQIAAKQQSQIDVVSRKTSVRVKRLWFCKYLLFDAAGDRTVKTSGAGQSVSVNGVVSGGATGTTNFTAYISPYMVVNNGGFYSKHIYMGSQRIVSKLNSSEIFIDTVPTVKKKAYNMNFTSKLTDLTSKIKVRYDSLGVPYKGTSQGNGSLITPTAGIITSPQQYYFHSDNLGSTSIITDISGNVAQHIEYIPFGEVFIDERPSTGIWSTPYKFNAKELDEETGLYYYGARYYDPRTSVWISVDPLAEKYPNVSSYVYCADNPVKCVDPDGKRILPSAVGLDLIRKTLTSQEAQYVQLDKNGYIDVNNLAKGQTELGNVGGNYSALLSIAQNDKTVEVSAPYDKSAMNDDYEFLGGSNIAFPFKDPIIENGEFVGSGGIGITLAPIGTERTENDGKQKQMLDVKDRYNSTNGNYQVQANGRLVPFKTSKKDAVKSIAHELYGHLLFMFKKKDALHQYGGNGSGHDANTDLKNQINERVKEAEKNYNNQTK
jgi:RHS repeat-associated protein